MKYILTLMFMVAAFALPTFAQTTYENNVSVVYTGGQVDVKDKTYTVQKENRLIGVQVSRVGFLSEHFALGGEATASTSVNSSQRQLYTVMPTLTVAWRRDKAFSPRLSFGGGLGITRYNSETSSNSDTSVSGAFKMSGSFLYGEGKTKWKVLEVGYLNTNLRNTRVGNLVISTGVNF